MRSEILGCVVSVVILSSLFTSAHAQNNRTSTIANRVREMDDDDLICKLNICSYRVGGNREPTFLTHISIAAFFFGGGGRGHMKTVLTQIRRHRMRRFTIISTICFLNVLLKFEQNEKYHPTTIKTGNSIRRRWVKLNIAFDSALLKCIILST